MNCHMPHTSYALLNATRNHRIASPDIGASASLGVPNACNLCHLDKTLAWSQTSMEDWYGHEPTALTDDQKKISASLIWLLSGDAAQRVVVAWHVGWKPAQQASRTDWLAPFQSQLLADPYGVVRYVAAASLRKLPDVGDFDYDFLASEREQRRIADQITDRWEQNSMNRKSADGVLLIHSDGTLNRSELQRMLENRNDRPVIIKE